MKISLAQARRCLAVGTVVLVSYPGTLTVMGNCGSTTWTKRDPEKRVIIKQTASKMQSKVIDEGDRLGRVTAGDWYNTLATKVDNTIQLLHKETNEPYVTFELLPA